MIVYRAGVLGICAMLLLSACQSPATRPNTPDKRPVATTITDERLPEISGLAASQTSTDLYAINDSGNVPSIYIIDDQLTVKKEITLAITNRDWEDLASFSLHGEDWIVIAESGDNLLRYKRYHLYFYREKELHSDHNEPLAPSFSLSYTYETGSVNCEAIVVDASSETILLFGKTNDTTPVFSMSLSALQTDSSVEAKLVAQLPAHTNNPANSLIRALTGVNLDSTTAATLTADGQELFLLTYRDVWKVERKLDQSWEQAFQSIPIHLASHQLRQAEAIAHRSTEKQLLVTSEVLPAPVLSFNY